MSAEHHPFIWNFTTIAKPTDVVRFWILIAEYISEFKALCVNHQPERFQLVNKIDSTRFIGGIPLSSPPIQVSNSTIGQVQRVWRFIGDVMEIIVRGSTADKTG